VPFTLAGAALALRSRVATRRWSDARNTLPFAATIWCLIVLFGVSFSSGKRVDYIFPAMIPGGLLAAWLLTTLTSTIARRLPKLRPLIIALPAVAALAYGVVVARNTITRGVEAETRWTSHALRFVDQIRPLIDDDPLLVLVRGKTPLATLLGVHHGNGVTDEQLANASWVITEVIPGAHATRTSQLLPCDFKPGTLSVAKQHALYYRERLTDDQLHSARRNMLTWTIDDNPYRNTRNFPKNWDQPRN
ncbi:MAG: hypothetical protein AAF561_09490, partial [Planctomycetota bacterium]